MYICAYCMYVHIRRHALIYCYTTHYAYILYVCDQQPVTVLPACPHQDQVSGIPNTLSLDHPDKLLEVGQSCDFTQCKATVKSGGRRCNNFANMYVYICMYCTVRIFVYSTYIRTYECTMHTVTITYLCTLNSC